MSLKETPSFSSQFSFQNEVALLKRNLTTGAEAVKDNLAHFFSEFALQVPLVSYGYDQIGPDTLMSPGIENEGDVLNIAYRGLNPNSRRSWKEYYGFAKFRKLILQTKEPSCALWFSPPGPKDEGYGDYGFLYGALIPQFQNGNTRRISMFALRINNFDKATQEKAMAFIKSLNPKLESEEQNLESDLLANPTVLTNGSQKQVEDVMKLFTLIANALPGKVDLSIVNDGLANNLLQQVKTKFKAKIHEIYTNIWSQAHNIAANVDGKKLFDEYLKAQGILFRGGSCPAARANSFESQINNQGKELHWCPQCSMFFYGTACGCGYKIGSLKKEQQK